VKTNPSHHYYRNKYDVIIIAICSRLTYSIISPLYYRLVVCTMSHVTNDTSLSTSKSIATSSQDSGNVATHTDTTNTDQLSIDHQKEDSVDNLVERLSTATCLAPPRHSVKVHGISTQEALALRRQRHLEAQQRVSGTVIVNNCP
jgi:hypothetical protein